MRAGPPNMFLTCAMWFVSAGKVMLPTGKLPKQLGGWDEDKARSCADVECRGMCI